MEATFVVTSRTIARLRLGVLLEPLARDGDASLAVALRLCQNFPSLALQLCRRSALASRASASSSELCSRSTSPAWRRTAARYSTTRCVLTTVSARIARWPKRSVAVVSPACRGSGEHVNSRTRHPFPKQSRSKRVSFESR